MGNQVVDDQGRLGVIDFNRWDYGDPWEEFNRVVWCAQASAAYASGYINGYFGGVPGEAFFRLLRLYIAANQLSSVPWAIPFGQGEIDVMTRQARQVLDVNKSERHIRGGMATREKYLHQHEVK